MQSQLQLQPKPESEPLQAQYQPQLLQEPDPLELSSEPQLQLQVKPEPEQLQPQLQLRLQPQLNMGLKTDCQMRAADAVVIKKEQVNNKDKHLFPN